ncbi:MAG: hypothetical protein KAI25_10880, partial [Hyphomicrobiaceae bacterium]|nr:hypothetical protein [Hyphomicrobiaceae bacterium]
MKKKNLLKSYKLREKDRKIPLLATDKRLLELESQHKILFDSLREIQRSEKLSSEKIVRLINLPQESIPVSVFNTDLPPLEAVVFYLNKFTHIRKIAELLGRSEKTIWTTHKNSSGKEVVIDESGRLRVPVKILADRRFSILENVVRYLRDGIGLRQVEIANMLGKDRRAVWTVYNRAKKKGAINEDFADFISAGETKLLEFESKHKNLIDSLRELQRSEKLSSEKLVKLINL